MGNDIEIKEIEVIQGGLIQIDFENKSTKECYRVFCEPSKFFRMLGSAMQFHYMAFMDNYEVNQLDKESMELKQQKENKND
tara:strand:- start:13905 stop:14147 length:243 start_codon:yes stop_codon:yes gene_type:complete